RMLGSLNDLGLALRCVEAALNARPDDLPARLLHGQLLAHHGQFEEAAKEFDWVLARNPRVAMARWMLARQRKATPRANQVGPLRALLSQQGAPPREYATAARALHKELDELGDHEGAWQALGLMC